MSIMVDDEEEREDEMGEKGGEDERGRSRRRR